MLIGISKHETEEYISQYDKSKSREEGATVFLIGAVDVDVRAMIADRTLTNEFQEGGTLVQRMASGTRNLEAVRFGLRGWDNFKDDKGNDLKFSTVKRIVAGKEYDIASNETLVALGTALITELGNHILDKNSMVQSLEKNLQMPSAG